MIESRILLERISLAFIDLFLKSILCFVRYFDGYYFYVRAN